MESNWVDLSDDKALNADNKPRLLTHDEIEDILDSFPEIRCYDKDAKEVATETLKDSYRDMLYYVYLDPSMIDEYKKTIARKFSYARIVTGTSMLTTSDALAETVTQTTLSGFHASGSATSALTGIEGLKTLIFAYKPKNKVSIIHLKEPPKSFDEALAARKKIEGLSIMDLVDTKKIDIDNLSSLSRPAWYDLYEVIHGPISEEDDYDPIVMRLPLKMNKVIYYNISLKYVCQIIEDTPFGEYRSNSVKAIYSPVSEAMIDIHLISGTITVTHKELLRYSEIAFFRNVVGATLDIMHINGIPTAKKIYPVSLPVWDKSITLARRPSEEELEQFDLSSFGDVSVNNIWLAKLNNSSREKSGVTLDEIYYLLDGLGLKSLVDAEEKYVIIMNNFSKEDISTFIRERKNGLPYVRGSDILSVKVDKDISYANIRFVYHNGDFFIKYDNKYIKKVLSALKKDFAWSLRDSMEIWRAVYYDEKLNDSVEKLVTVEPVNVPNVKYDTVKVYRLSRYPSWLTEKSIRDEPLEIASRLESFVSTDKNRVFFLRYEGKNYIHIPNNYASEVQYYLDKGKYNLSEEVKFYYKLEDEPNIQVSENQTENTDYLKVEPKYRLEIEKRLDVEWGEKSRRKFIIRSEYRTSYSFDRKDSYGEITLHGIKITERDEEKIATQIKDSKNSKFVDYYINGDDTISLSKEENIELDELIATALTSSFKSSTAATNYEHWYLTSKDKIDKYYTFYDTLAHPDIDSERTYVNSPNEITSVLGVEAAYTYFIKALKDLNDSSGNYIDPRHILLIADFIFSRGKPNGVLFSGLSRQPLGHITLITVERAMEVLRKLAFASNRENVNSVSAALATGQNNPTGTGMYGMSDDPNIQKAIRKYSENVKDINLSSDQMSNAIRKLNKAPMDAFEAPVQEPPNLFTNRKNYSKFTFNDLLQDVVEKANIDDYLMNSTEKVEYPPDPNFVIKKMKAPDAIVQLLSSTVSLEEKGVKEKPKSKAVTRTPIDFKRRLPKNTERPKGGIAKIDIKEKEETKGEAKEEAKEVSKEAKEVSKEAKEVSKEAKEVSKEEKPKPPAKMETESSLGLPSIDISTIGKEGASSDEPKEVKRIDPKLLRKRLGNK